MTVRVIEYFVDIEGQKVPEMFCLITDLLGWEEYPGPELAALYRWRWDGSETGLREAKATLHGAGPGTGAMLRSGSPELIAQEIAAWTVSTEMTRGVTRDAALAAAPARKGRRAGLPVRSRDLSLTRSRRLILAAIRTGKTSYQALTRQIAKHRVVTGRNRHRDRKSKSPSTFPHAGPGGQDHPHRPGRHHHGQHARLTSGNPRKPAPPKPARPPQNAQPARGTGPPPARHAGHRHTLKPATTQRHRKQNRPSRPKPRKPVALTPGPLFHRPRRPRRLRLVVVEVGPLL